MGRKRLALPPAPWSRLVLARSSALRTVAGPNEAALRCRSRCADVFDPSQHLSGPRDQQIIRKSGALKSVGPDDWFWPVESGARPKRPEHPAQTMQTRRSASPDDGFWPVESETRTKRYRYSPTNPAGGMVERPTGRTIRRARTTNRNHPSNKRSERANGYR
jgi:hypothetical protein